MPSASQMAITLLLKADISGFEGKMRKLESAMQGSLKRMNTRGHAMMKKGLESKTAGLENMAKGAAGLAPFALLLKGAMDLEDKVADVAKVTGAAFGSKEFDKLKSTAREVSDHLGRSSSDAAELMANLAAGGVAEKDLKKVAMQAGEIGVAFDVTAGEAGQAYMVIKNAMNLTSKQTTATLDAMNAATNKFGGKASELLNFMAQGGAGVAQTLKVSGVDMQAFGNAFQVIGKSSGEAATTMQRFQKAVLSNSELRNIFNKAGGGSAGLVAILEKAQKSGDAYTFLKDRGVGEYSSNLAQIATNVNSDKGVKRQLQFLQKTENVEGSAHQEFINRQKTTKEQFNKTKVAIMNSAIALGDTLIPAMRDLMETVKPIIDGFSKWIKDNPELTKTILKVVAASAALKLGVGALQFAWGGTFGMVGRLITNGTRTVQSFKNGVKWIQKTKKALKQYRGAMALAAQSKKFAGVPTTFKKIGGAFTTVGKAAKTGVVKGIKGIGKAFSAVTKLLMANPWILVITAIVAAVYLIIKNWDKIKAFFARLWAGVKKIFSATWQWIKKMFLNYTPFGLIIKHWDKITAFFSGLWESVKGLFSAFWEWLTGWATKLKDIGVNLVKAIWEGIKEKWQWLKSKALSLWNDFKGIFGFGNDEAASGTVSSVVGNTPTPQPVPLRSGSNDRFNFAPVINVSGSMNTADSQKMTAQMRRDFERQMTDYQYNKQRKGF